MKKLLIIALLLTVTPAFAAHVDQSTLKAEHQQSHEAAYFAQQKNRRAAVLTHRVSASQKKLTCLQAAQSCVNSASDMRTLDSCHTGCGD